jgi:hypothetical protein
MFIAGGRGRKARLAVMDAAPVDNHRRLVLVRRDDVEHLLMIGDAGDIVIEQNIRIGAPAGRNRSIFGDGAAPQVPDMTGAEPQVPEQMMADPAPVERRRSLPQTAPAVASPVQRQSNVVKTAAEKPVVPEVQSVRPEAVAEPEQAAVKPPAIAPAPQFRLQRQNVPAANSPERDAAPSTAPAMPAVADSASTAVSPASQAETVPAAVPVAPAAPTPFPQKFRRPATGGESAVARIFGQSRKSEQDAPEVAPEPSRKPAGNLEEEMEKLLNELTGTNN